MNNQLLAEIGQILRRCDGVGGADERPLVLDQDIISVKDAAKAPVVGEHMRPIASAKRGAA